MTKDEILTIMAVLKVAYPSYYRNIGKEDAVLAVNLWAEMFADDDAATVAAAVKKLIATRKDGYPPTIGEVKSILTASLDSDNDEQKAWHLASSAAAGNIPWDRLPTTVQRAIGSKNVLREWGMIETDTFNTVIYSQFLKIYRTCKQRERDDAALPSSLRNMLGSMTEKMSIPANGHMQQLPASIAGEEFETKRTEAKRLLGAE